jgi:hypothetical protein
MSSAFAEVGRRPRKMTHLKVRRGAWSRVVILPNPEGGDCSDELPCEDAGLGRTEQNYQDRTEVKSQKQLAKPVRVLVARFSGRKFGNEQRLSYIFCVNVAFFRGTKL